MAKKYIVDLSEDKVSHLQTLIKKGKRKVTTKVLTLVRLRSPSRP
ncbi:hypothetical protein [Scytonema sp. UIC 10036]|nr:hypothetical protein [Scytonema sp. UIC 10036]